MPEDMDIPGELEELAEHYDSKNSVLDTFIKEDLPSCHGYVLIYVDKEERVGHVRWNMRPWKVRGAIDDVKAYLTANAVVGEIERGEENA